jgi:hypothetical protein
VGFYGFFGRVFLLATLPAQPPPARRRLNWRTAGATYSGQAESPTAPVDQQQQQDTTCWQGCGSGSRKAKMTHKSKKILKFMF